MIDDSSIKFRLKKMEWLEPALKGWVHAMDRYINAERPGWDLPYFRNEISTLSFLSGGAWCKNYVAIQEYTTRKNDVSKKGPTRKYGRADLYIYDYGRSKKDAVLEAKQVFCVINSAEKSVLESKSVSKAWDTARSDAKRGREGSHNVGLTIITPRFNASKWIENKDQVNVALANLIKEAEGSLQNKSSDAVMTYFPSCVRNCKFEASGSGKEYLYPGIVVLLNNV